MTNLDLISAIFSGCMMIISGAFLGRLAFARKFFRLKQAHDQYINFSDLPTVSVCIPARNETEAIQACLERVMASDYPKMEVIVLDDNSVDNTSDMVRSFATAGVRFIKGDKLPKGWIGKNYALKQLTDQATGSYILFMSADTLIGEKDIGTLIRYALEHKLSMLSVMPKRNRLRANVLFGSLRFFWELILHSRNFPAISTSAWLIKAKDLEDYGNFWEINRATIRPESALASFFYGKRKYRFLVANHFLNISHEKGWHNQISTSIRTSGPVFDKSIWLKANVIVVLGIIVAGSALTFFRFFASGVWWIRIIDLAGLLSLSLLSLSYAALSWPKGWILALFTWPWSFLQELVIVLISVFYNKFNLLSWKGRSLPRQED